jgi:cytidine deaminase
MVKPILVAPNGIDTDTLLLAARTAMANAYAPYSNIRVAAALLIEDGSIVTGVNVENASYGLTICAERTAVVSAVTQGKQWIKAVAITTNGTKPISPCGACRQVLSEFSFSDTIVILDVGEGLMPTIYKLAELLPMAFKLCST